MTDRPAASDPTIERARPLCFAGRDRILADAALKPKRAFAEDQRLLGHLALPSRASNKGATVWPPLNQRAIGFKSQETWKFHAPCGRACTQAPAVVFFRLRGISATNSSPPCDCITIVALAEMHAFKGT